MESNVTKPLEDVVSMKKVILLDIEGTTTSIDFVRDVLFVKARENVEEFLQNHYEENRIQQVIEDLKKQINVDVANKVEGALALPSEEKSSKCDVISALVKNLKAMMDANRKIGPLKTLQGYIWRNGYKHGTFKGHVYDDVVPTLERWQKEGKTISIYSSGSVEAQKLLFSYSTQGNILHFFSNYFDTGVGLKGERESYSKIGKELKIDPKFILFVTDVEQEANAASSAGMDVVLSIRPGNKPLTKEALQKFPTVTTFSDFLRDNDSTSSPPAKKRRSSSPISDRNVKQDSKND